MTEHATMTDQELAKLITAYGDASFSCGNHRDDDEIPYDAVHARSKVALQALTEALERLAHQVISAKGQHSVMTMNYEVTKKKKEAAESQVAELLEALKELVFRFEKCVVLSGTDKEYAPLTTSKERALIAKAEGRS